MGERNSAQLREEDIFEQMLAMEESLVDTTEGYLTEKLTETEAEVNILQERLVEEERRRKAFRRLFSAIRRQSGDSVPVAEGLKLASADADPAPARMLEMALLDNYEDDFDP